MRSSYLKSLGEGQYIPSLFATIIRELDVDTEHPVEIGKMSYEQFELEDEEDAEKKIQGNIAFVFSQALNYTSSLLRYVKY